MTLYDLFFGDNAILDSMKIIFLFHFLGKAFFVNNFDDIVVTPISRMEKLVAHRQCQKRLHEHEPWHPIHPNQLKYNQPKTTEVFKVRSKFVFGIF